MPTYQELDEDALLRAIEGYTDELVGERRKLSAFYRQFNCPRCKGECDEVFISVDHSLPKDDELVQRSGLKCRICEAIFDPHTGIIVSLGNPGKIQDKYLATQPILLSNVDDDLHQLARQIEYIRVERAHAV